MSLILSFDMKKCASLQLTYMLFTYSPAAQMLSPWTWTLRMVSELVVNLKNSLPCSAGRSLRVYIEMEEEEEEEGWGGGGVCVSVVYLLSRTQCEYSINAIWFLGQGLFVFVWGGVHQSPLTPDQRMHG